MNTRARLAFRRSTVALLLSAALHPLAAQNPAAPPKPAVPEWAQPGSATHTQVAPPADFHRPSKNFDTPIGIFEGQSDIGSAVVPGSASYDAATQAVHHQLRRLQRVVYPRRVPLSLEEDVGRRFARRPTSRIRTPKVSAIARPCSSSGRTSTTIPRKRIIALHGLGMIHLAQRPEKNVRGSRIMEYRIGGRGRARRRHARQPRRRHGQAHRHRKARRLVRAIRKPGRRAHAPVRPPITLHLSEPFYVGIGFCSHLPDKSDTAVLSNVVLENAAGKVR